MTRRYECEAFHKRYEIDGATGCWLWRGTIGPNGYGVFWYAGKRHPAHRWYYQKLHGEVPKHLDMDHLCRVRRCVNPAHLEPVTRRENLLRGDTLPAKQVKRTHCPRGHAYDEKNTRVSNGLRFCRTCDREKQFAKRHASGPVAPPNRDRTHCPRGHAYDADNTYVRPGGGRVCRKCWRDKARAKYAAQYGSAGEERGRMPQIGKRRRKENALVHPRDASQPVEPSGGARG